MCSWSTRRWRARIIYDYIYHRAYMDPGRRGLLLRPRYEPRACAFGDMCHVRRV
jgi:hypothetical protein